MRLLDTSKIELKTFIGTSTPDYAILSHTWGNNELLFEHVRPKLAEEPNSGQGLGKVLKACEMARQLGLEWIWIDTCCIDKTSSAELSEAINSMFNWYKDSAVCLAFLEDVTFEPGRRFDNLEKSRWFTRGWTLQELIAPCHVEFFDRNWKYLASSGTIASQISKITGIAEDYICHCHFPAAIRLGFTLEAPLLCRKTPNVNTLNLSAESVATRMQWVAKRETTRPEDISYCLMGIFDVNMPLLYGEGVRKSFHRLQQAIISTTEDESILLWRAPAHGRIEPDFPILAKDPSWFADSGSLTNNRLRAHARNVVITSAGLELKVLLTPCQVSVRVAELHSTAEPTFYQISDLFLVVLDCHVDGTVLKRPAICCTRIDSLDSGVPTYSRALPSLSLTLSAGQEIKGNGVLNTNDPTILQTYRARVGEAVVKSIDFDVDALKLQEILYRSYDQLEPQEAEEPALQICLTMNGTAHKQYKLRTSVKPKKSPNNLMIWKPDLKSHHDVSFHFADTGSGLLRKALFFWNPASVQPSVFFVLVADISTGDAEGWPGKSKQVASLSPPHPQEGALETICWIETWRDFTGKEDFSEEVAKKLEDPEKLEQTARRYFWKQEGTSQWSNNTVDLEPVRVAVGIDMVSFLGYDAKRVTVQVDWSKDMESEKQQVESGGWRVVPGSWT